MKSNRFSRLFLLTVSGFAIVNGLPYFRSAAYAGLIGNLDNASLYVNFGSSNNFPWVGGFFPLNIDKATKAITTSKNELSRCTITVIDRPEKNAIWALTAAHCVYGRDDKSKKIKSYNSGVVYFGEGNKLDQNKYLLVADTIIKREYIKSVNEGKKISHDQIPVDIALVKLVPDPTQPYPTWLSDAIKSKPRPKLPSTRLPSGIYTGNFVGIGDQGSGASGNAGFSIYSPNYLGGKNAVQVLNNFLSYDFDSKLNPKTNFDGNSALDLEYNPTNGDSGSPIFIDNILAGVHSRSQGGSYVCGNELCRFNRGFYGTIGYALRTDQYISWINKTITGSKFTDAVSLKIAKGGKFNLKPVDKSKSPDLREEANTFSIEIPNGSTFYIFTPSEDKPDTPS
jgi:hypothetical protein